MSSAKLSIAIDRLRRRGDVKGGDAFTEHAAAEACHLMAEQCLAERAVAQEVEVLLGLDDVAERRRRVACTSAEKLCAALACTSASPR